MIVNADFWQVCEQPYLSRSSMLRPVDPRMQKVQFATHTWMLRLAGIIASKWSQQPTAEQIATGVRDEWVTFKNLYSKQKLVRSVKKEWEDFKSQFLRLAGEVMQQADIFACTLAAVASEMLKSTDS